jgi:hypothetical protein
MYPGVSSPGSNNPGRFAGYAGQRILNRLLNAGLSLLELPAMELAAVVFNSSSIADSLFAQI